MTTLIDPFVALALWVILAWGLSVVLSGPSTWKAAYGLMALGAPLLIWLYAVYGAGGTVVGLITGLLVLRWPVIYLLRWLRARVGKAG